MIRFYPRNIGKWRGQFDFSDRITLEVKELKSSKDFYDRNELIEFLKSNGVRLDDPRRPLKFEEMEHTQFGRCYVVHQWTVLGWFTDDFK
tara:strand:+ start:2913 stop:3182 length:270 start_codon:yes stop_codon:yes gene_type:complete